MQAHIKFIRTLRAICHTISPQVFQQSISKKTRKRHEKKTKTTRRKDENDTKKEAAQKRERPRAQTPSESTAAIRGAQASQAAIATIATITAITTITTIPTTPPIPAHKKQEYIPLFVKFL